MSNCPIDHALGDVQKKLAEQQPFIVKSNSHSNIAYESRLKKIIDDEAKVDYTRCKGEEEGKIDVILQGAKNGLDITIHAQITGFSEERVADTLRDDQ